jgi:CMP-N-acetylneuraminic acid synthetase
MKLVIIPARGGSKGIPRKNIKDLCGKPLIAWAIEQISMAGFKAIVSTEDAEISKISKQYGAVVFDRSEDLARDNIHAVHAMIEVLEHYEPFNVIDAVGMILATSPLRTAEDIANCFTMFDNNECDSVISVCETNKPSSCFRHINGGVLYPILPIKHFEIQRQDAEPLYEVNGSIYVACPEALKKYKSFHQGKVLGYVMDRRNTIDINDEYDWHLAEILMGERLANA